MVAFDEDAKYVLWTLIEKYDNKYPKFCDILSRLIQNKFVHEDILCVLDYCYTKDKLEDLDALELKGILDQYYDNISTHNRPIDPNIGFLLIIFCLTIGS